jgi:hypothetical protein
VREIASAIVACVILLIVVGLVGVLAAQSLIEDVQYIDPQGDPHLRLVWRALVWFVTGGDTVAKVFTGLVAIVGVAIQSLAQLHKRAWSVVAVCLVCLIGVVGCVIVMVITSEAGGAVISTLRADVTGDETALRGSIQTFMGLVIGWLVLFLGTQLGISAGKSTGTIHAFLRSHGVGGEEGTG